LAAGAVEVVTASTGSHPGRSQAAGNGAHPSARHAIRRRHSDARAIDRVLRYTAFIAAGTPRRRVIALTFDDGPSPYTPEIVRILVRWYVPATFFVVGQQLRYFSAGVRDELRHGFEVGDHTENHAWLVRLGAAQQRAQVGAVAGQLQRLGGPAPRLFRPPYGVWNSTTLATLRRLHMLMVLWSIDPGDWRRPGTKAIVSDVLSHSKPGAIVILHDGGGDRNETAAALPAIIRGLRRRGYTLVSVPRLLALDPPGRRQRIPRLGAA
jgi:peptidoglycan/xylan/chitin deacetylase (PgdA/CDA1 family)